jgi:hypothetical protein
VNDRLAPAHQIEEDHRPVDTATRERVMDTDKDRREDEVEGHGFSSGRGPAEAADVQAHSIRSGRRNEDGPPPEGEEREPAIPDADDDVEGHTARSGR